MKQKDSNVATLKTELETVQNDNTVLGKTEVGVLFFFVTTGMYQDMHYYIWHLMYPVWECTYVLNIWYWKRVHLSQGCIPCTRRSNILSMHVILGMFFLHLFLRKFGTSKTHPKHSYFSKILHFFQEFLLFSIFSCIFGWFLLDSRWKYFLPVRNILDTLILHYNTLYTNYRVLQARTVGRCWCLNRSRASTKISSERTSYR